MKLFSFLSVLINLKNWNASCYIETWLLIIWLPRKWNTTRDFYSVRHILTVQRLEIELIYIDDKEKDTIHPRVFVPLCKYIAISSNIIA